MPPARRRRPDLLLPRRQAIGEQIRVAREAAKLSQEEVANRIGIDRPSIVLIEAGTRNATINTLLRISDAIGVELANLVR